MGISPTIFDYVDEHSRRTPVANAVLEKNRKALSFEDLLAQIQYVQSIFDGLKFDRNDRIAIALPNNGNMVTSLLGVMSCAIAVPLNPNLTESEFDEYLALVKAKALIVEADGDTPARMSAQRLGLRVLETRCASDAPTGAFHFAEVDRIPLRPLSKPDALDIGLMQLTTGSTSRPKIVPLSHRTLTHRALKHARWVSLDDADRGLLFMPLFHGQGLNMGIIPSVIVGGSIVVVPDFNVDAFLGLLQEFQPTWYTASPAHHRAILGKAEENNAAFNQCRLRFIRSGSQNLSPQLSAKLTSAFGAPVIETYNTSETGQLAGGLLSESAASKDDGLALSDDVAVMDESGGMLPTGEVGEVVSRGESVFEGYADSGESTDVVFTNGWFRTGDLGCITPNGRLILKGRKKELINRGGEKIAPLEVDQVLESHPDVESAVSFGIPHPSLGEQVAAAVIAREGSIATEAELRRFALSRLASFKVPRRIALVSEFPVGPSAKADRKALAAMALADWARPLQHSTAKRASITPLQARILEIWKNYLNRDDICIEDDFFMLGGDSLQAIDMFLQLEQELGITLSPSVLFEAGTIEDMTRLIASERSEDTLVPLNDSGNLPPFFCVHDGEGNTIGFRHLAQLLGRDQPFYGLQPTWAFGKGELLTRVEDMALRYVDAIRSVQPSGPYFIGGYSFGGKVAYEMARNLHVAGEKVSLLALIDSHMYGTKAPIGMWVRGHLRVLSDLNTIEKVSYVGKRVLVHAVDIARSPFAWLSKPLHEVAKETHSAGRALSPRLVRAVSSVAARDYKPAPHLGRTVLFHTTLHPSDHPDIYEKWRDLVPGRIDFIHIPGDHWSILRTPDVECLAEMLQRSLHHARAADGVQ